MRIVFCLSVSLLIAAPIGGARADEDTTARPGETVLDRKVHIEPDLILDIPKVPRICDEMDIWKRHVHIGDCSLYCEQEGKGTPMVLVNGGPGATHHGFHPHFSRAKDFLRLIYYDQRGCGISQYWDGDGYSVGQAVEDLDKLREALGINKWVVLGHSYGGTLAQCYTVRHPEHVAGLVLVGSSCDALPVEESRSRQYDFISSEERKKIQQIHGNTNLTGEQAVFNAHLNGDWKRQNFYRPSREQLARGALYEWKHDEGFRPAMSASLGKLDMAGFFDECPVPVLIMEGKWDLTWGAAKPKNLHACFPGSRLVLFDRAAHSPFEDEPEKFFAVLKEFVQKLQDVSAADVASWKQHIDKLVKERQEAILVGEASQEVVFRTAQVAPSGFEFWSFHWTIPEVEPEATLQYVVLQPDGKEYHRYSFSDNQGKGRNTRSDFAEGFAGGDPAVFYNHHITIKFLVDKGRIKFPENRKFRFEFRSSIEAVRED
ncbi:MAG: alpha/beta fold hydrolase [Phycisphaerales bacterium]|nr:MAG: alpha/beta fold hydrolase [Phycisphaerales bacterium]